MKKVFVAAVAALGIVACTSVETATVSGNEVAAQGEAVAVVQATSIGISAIFHIVDIIPSNLDQIVNKLLVAEAKSMGANKIDVKYAWTTPRHGIFALAGGIIGFPVSMGMGVAVK
jgi:hypothetical protein